MRSLDVAFSPVDSKNEGALRRGRHPLACRLKRNAGTQEAIRT